MKRQFRPHVHVLFASTLLFMFNGCHFTFPFEINGLVSDVDGNPLAGVNVSFNAESIRESSFPVFTGPDGSFKALVRIGDIVFMKQELPKWSLSLSKDGYETNTMDVSPRQQPESPKKTTVITLQATLKVKK